MKLSKKISLLTLLGVIFPLGNVWGPFLIRVSREEAEYRFRKKLVLFELLLTISCIALSTILTSMAIGSTYNVGLITGAMCVLLFHHMLVMMIALFLCILKKS